MGAALRIAALCGAAVAGRAGAGAGAPPRSETMHLHVSQRGGSDAADGSADRPFATIRRALELAARFPERRSTIQLGIGHYGPDTGESFPIRLRDRVRLAGSGSRSCEIVGLPDLPVIELPASGSVTLESVVLRGGSSGIAAAAGCDADRLEAAVVDVAIEGGAAGVDLARARGRIALRADGLRVSRASGPGLAAAGAAALELTLDRCSFRECREGVAISCDGAPPEGPDHALVARDCRFEGNELSGLVRQGADGRNRAAAPWRLESCLVRGSRIGVALEIPGGDIPFLLRDCEFVENEIFGLSMVGSGDPLEGAARVEACRFRWNGVGAQILTMGRPLELVECRFEDSVGIGLHFGNWVGERSVLRAQRCIFACNGAAGLFVLCEREDGIDVSLDRCTVVDNRGSGVERRNRQRGSGPFRLARCVVAGNSPDLARIDAAELHDCAVGGDPRFVDRAARDWRLAPDSPARGEEGGRGALDGASRPASDR